MNKCLIAVLVLLGLTSCSVKDEQYYQLHPDKLQQAIKTCSEQQGNGLTCKQLKVVAKRMNRLAYELQLSPQAFGSKIIALQETIAEQHVQLKSGDADADLQANLEQNKRDLAYRMAVVKWLESPMS